MNTQTTNTNTPTTRLLRPGLLVALKTSIQGGVSYRTLDLETDHAEGIARVARWETTRYITDADEHAAAVKARSAARGAVLAVTRDSSFGLLCPVDSEGALYSAVAQARAIAEAFNARANHSRINVAVLIGRIAQDDAEAARAIGAEVRELLSSMEAAVKATDPEAIRAAASKAKELSSMLSEGAQTAVSAAIAEVRAVARGIVKRAGQSGERAAEVVSEVTLQRLSDARFAVLDLEPASVDAAAQPLHAAPALDLMPMDAEAPAAPFAVPAPAFDLFD